MSGSDNGSYGNHAGDRAVNGGPTAAPPARSASPAKRSAADMERGQMGRKQQQQITPGSFSTLQNDGPTDFDEAMLGITSTSNGTDTQGTEIDPFAASNEVSMATNTATTSFELDGSVESSMNGDCHLSAAHKEPYSTEEVVQQVERVYGECNKPIDEGSRGVVISTKWLGRVLSRTREGLTSGQYPKEAREGPVGPVDNSDIIPEGGLQEPLLNDSEKFPFVPLKPGLTAGEEFEIVPHQAYDFIMGEYGYKSKYPIIRYAHDTAIESPSQNIMYETYPPTITIRKVPQPNQATEQTHTKPSGALAALHQRSERKTRGQNSPDDAIRLVSSRSERFQTFLARSKEAAGIPRTTKVRLWRLLNPENVTVELPNQQQATAMSLPTTRQTSPSRAADSLTAQLIVDQDTFQKMNLGTQLEHIDVQDETNNDKYNGKSTMDTIGLSQHQTIILEEQLGGPGGGEFRSDSKKSLKLLTRKLGGSKSESAPVSGRTSPAPTGAMTRGRARRDSRTRGTVGLTNLGNTCYMNSALQCIRSVEELAVFFLSSAYKKEINNDNPLGHNGAMATSYAGVLRGIYNDGATSAFSPSDFKRKLGTIQPLFSGYGQQDSQEFLSFLVDALHEDLNRIKKKPYNENPDSDDKTVHDPQAIIELGEVYRTNHRARNDSVAMDLFSGFYKNTMECPVCDRISITFDPYSLLTVQLPIESTFQHLITFVPLHGSPINHALDIDKNASIKSVKELIASKHPGVQADRLWMTEIYSSKVFKVFEDSTPISEANIVANDLIWLFELDDVPKNLPAPRKQTYSAYYRPTGDDAIVPDMDSPNADCFAVPIFSRHKDSFDNYKLGLHPLYITITREEAKDYEVILKKILIAVSKLTSRPILKEFDDGVSRVVESSGDLRSDEERPGAEDAAGVSDHSAQSEDSYVKVSIDKADLRADSGAQQDDAAMQVDEVESTVPAHFMEPGYFLSPALRHQLFDLKYAKSSEGMHCTSTPAYKEPPFPMHDRVKLSTRRSSVQSSVSDESTTSTGSAQRGNDDNDQSEESDDDSEKPDIVLSEPTMSTPFIMEDDDEEELPLNPLQPRSPRGGRRRAQKGKNKNHNKKNKHQNVKTYGNKDKGRYNSKQIHNYNRSPIAIKTVPDDEGPYYIQLGEGIVLDWHAEALDSLFGGDANTEGDLRGYRLTTDDGKGMPDFHDPELDAKKLKRAERKRHGIDLEDCFVETGKREVLSEDNAWYCNRCKEMRRAAKTLEIWTIPDILVVHLKRFGGNRSFRDKIDVFVDYPIEGLDMTDKVGLKEDGKEYVYDLFAVDNHYGGLGGGHYTALAKNFYDGEWYDYNDSTCSRVGMNGKLHSPAAYLLFYRRRSDKPLGPPYLQDLVYEARHPTSIDGTNEDATAEDSDSGEGRLGGPTPSSLHGSSSAFNGAGVGAANHTSTTSRKGYLGNGGRAGAPAPADSSLTQKQTKTIYNNSNNDNSRSLGHINGKPVLGPHRPPPLVDHAYGSQGNEAWDFTPLQNTSYSGGGGAAAEENLLGNMSDRDNDIVSTITELDDQDDDSAYGESIGGNADLTMDDDDDDDDLNHYSDAHEYGGVGRMGYRPAGRGSPIIGYDGDPGGIMLGLPHSMDDEEEYHDDDAERYQHHSHQGMLFADAPEHVEHGNDDDHHGGEGDSPPVDIHLPANDFDDEEHQMHIKID